MEKIMEIPSPHPYYHTTYKDHKHSFMKGDKVLDMFYSQGIWKENYIPKELEDKHCGYQIVKNIMKFGGIQQIQQIQGMSI